MGVTWPAAPAWITSIPRPQSCNAADDEDPRLQLCYASAQTALRPLQRAQLHALIAESFGVTDPWILGAVYWFATRHSKQPVFLVNIAYERERAERDLVTGRTVLLTGYMLFNVCLAPEWRGRHLSTPLLEAVLALFQQQHPWVQQVLLEVWQADRAAVRLYLSLGFVPFAQLTRLRDRLGRPPQAEPMWLMNKIFPH